MKNKKTKKTKKLKKIITFLNSHSNYYYPHSLLLNFNPHQLISL